MKMRVILCPLVAVLCVVGVASADVFKAGGDRLVATQNKDGCWDWPLLDTDLNVSNAPNILGPTGQGLLLACTVTGDPNLYSATQLAALKKAGDYLLSKKSQSITPEDGIFAVALDKVFGGTKYTDFMKKNFYEPLSKGTFDYLGNGSMRVNTSQYISIVRYLRNYYGVSNLAAMDCGLGLYAAFLVGADTTAWLAATKSEINELIRDPSYSYDVLGLAGAVLGLSAVGADTDPTFGPYTTAGNLSDLAGILASYQLATGGFTWNSLFMKEGAGNEQIQETAFGALALAKFNAQKYATNLTRAATYLKSVELPTGGWEDLTGSGENNEVTGEALWALGVIEQAKIK
jgi:hypothetical protein